MVGGYASGVSHLPVNEALQPANETPHGMPAVAAYAPLLTHTPQVWVRGKLWHAIHLSCRIPIGVLVNTGAGGGALRVTSLHENRRD